MKRKLNSCFFILGSAMMLQACVPAAIIVVAGTVAGGVIGVLLALFMNAITTYRRKEDLSK